MNHPSHKNPNTDIERYKSGFVVQGHKDREKGYLVHTSKTVKLRNIRHLITIAAK